MIKDFDKKDLAQMKEENPWLGEFSLTDIEFYNLVILITRVINSIDSLDVFTEKLGGIISDQKKIKGISLAAALKRFWPVRQYIKGVPQFIEKLGGQVPEQEEEEANKRTAKLENDTAKMVFSSTDEEEIKSLPKLEHKIPSADDYVAQAQVIIKDFGFQDKDEVIMKRLQNFVVAKLRDVRDDMETLEVLTKGRKIGGMELDEEKARFLLKLVRDKESSFKNGEVPAAEPAVKQKIDFPVYQELPKEKVSPAAGEPSKPLTLEEKREKDGYIVQETRNKIPSYTEASAGRQDTKEIPAKSETPFLPAQGGIAAAVAPIKEEKKVEDLITVDQTKKKKDTDVLPPQKEVYPIIEEEDGLPVIRMPEEVMVSPAATPKMNKADQSLPARAVIQPKKEEAITVAKNQPPLNYVQVNKPQENIITAEPAKQEVVIKKEETPVFQKPTNLPPANPQPYIAPAKSLPTRPPMTSARRPSLDDVKFVRKLVGPIEELETMTIIDFRRISPDPVAAAKKIKEKINLLEKELYTKRAEGIVAWHKSEVSRFYRLLGQASMTEGHSIEQIIAERLSAGKPTLTLEEFNAIMDLNRELRY